MEELSPLNGELSDIAERFAAADRRFKEAQAHGDRGEQEAALLARREAELEFSAAGGRLADLLLCLFRYARHHARDKLRLYLLDLLRPELDWLSEAVVRLERRRP